MSDVHFLTLLGFLPSPCPHWLWGPPSLLSSGCCVLFLCVYNDQGMKLLLISVKSKFLTVVTVLITAFKGMALCIEIDIDWHFRTICCHHPFFEDGVSLCLQHFCKLLEDCVISQSKRQLSWSLISTVTMGGLVTRTPFFTVCPSAF
jgi:hypothetical protein